MESASINLFPTVLGAAVLLVLLCLGRLLSTPKLPSEPPYIPSRLPIFGHALGLILHKTQYYQLVNALARFPIFTLSMPLGRVYVVTTPDLAVAVQRLPRALSFWWIEVVFGSRLAALSPSASAVLKHNVHGEEGSDAPSLFMEGNRFMVKVLKPGGDLDAMIESAAKSLTRLFAGNELQVGRTVDLWIWTRHIITLVTTDAFYGPQNPFRDSVVEEAFWQMVDDTPLLLLGILPSVFARRGHRGRKQVTAAFVRYFAEKGQDLGALITKGRFDVTSRHHLSVEDIARLEAVQSFTILSNTVPSGFWTLWHMLARPAILVRVRTEVENCILNVGRQGDGTILRTLKLGEIRNLPLLSAVMSEALRHQACGTVTRYATEDVLLNGTYTLQKGTFVVMPNQPMHFDESAWGPRVQDFEPERFMNSQSGTRVEKKKQHPGAYRPFGGGATLCPGRFFASTEILALVAMCALRFDVEPADHQGWANLQPDWAAMSSAVTPPKETVMVRMEPRAGWEEGTWTFEL